MKVGRTYTGKEFNLFNAEPCVKMTNRWMNHHGFQFQVGSNVDHIQFIIKINVDLEEFIFVK